MEREIKIKVKSCKDCPFYLIDKKGICKYKDVTIWTQKDVYIPPDSFEEYDYSLVEKKLKNFFELFCDF